MSNVHFTKTYVQTSISFQKFDGILSSLQRKDKIIKLKNFKARYHNSAVHYGDLATEIFAGAVTCCRCSLRFLGLQ
jgi:hypothetical protein